MQELPSVVRCLCQDEKLLGTTTHLLPLSRHWHQWIRHVTFNILNSSFSLASLYSPRFETLDSLSSNPSDKLKEYLKWAVII